MFVFKSCIILDGWVNYKTDMVYMVASKELIKRNIPYTKSVVIFVIVSINGKLFILC